MSATLDAKGLINWLRAKHSDSTPLEADDLNTIELSTEEISAQAERSTAQRDGWKEIGTVLIRAAFGFEMRGFSDTPPVELLDALKIPEMPKATPGAFANPTESAWEKAQTDRVLAEKAEAEAAIEALRDGLIGRAWHVGGHKGYGTCDYPLCAFRGKGVPLTTVALVGPETIGREIDGSTLKVCHHPGGQGNEAKLECLRWAQYVAARARAGRIKIG